MPHSQRKMYPGTGARHCMYLVRFCTSARYLPVGPRSYRYRTWYQVPHLVMEVQTTQCCTGTCIGTGTSRIYSDSVKCVTSCPNYGMVQYVSISRAEKYLVQKIQKRRTIKKGDKSLLPGLYVELKLESTPSSSLSTKEKEEEMHQTTATSKLVKTMTNSFFYQ